jgi:superfamily II DNA or RNA helicase
MVRRREETGGGRGGVGKVEPRSSGAAAAWLKLLPPKRWAFTRPGYGEPQVELASRSLTADAFHFVVREGRMRRTVALEQERQNGASKLAGGCSCPSGQWGPVCVHSLAAIEWLRGQLADPASQLSQDLEALVERPWEGSLAVLDNCLRRQNGDGGTEPASQRLVWLVELTGDGVDIEVVLQKRLKSGNWSKGRSLDLDRVLSTPSIWSCREDERLARWLKSNDSGRHWTFKPKSDLDPLEVFEELSTHPAVFWYCEPELPLQVRRGTLALAVIPEAGGALALALKLDGERLSREGGTLISPKGVVSADFDSGHVTLARCNTRILELVEHVLARQPLFPASARELLMERLPALEEILPVELPMELDSGTIEADARPHVILDLEADASLEVLLRVRPLEGGALLEPGEGPPRCGTWREGKRLAAHRDLAGERERAAALAGELLSAEGVRRERWNFEVGDLDLALDIVARLEQLPAERAVVEWVNSTPQRVSGSVGPKALRLHVEDRRDWFGIRGGIEVDGMRLELAALLESVRSGRRYVRVDGEHWAEISDELRRRLATLGDAVQGEAAGGELLIDATALPVLEEALEEVGVLEATKRWREMARRFREAFRLEPEVPASIGAHLREYQVEGFRWLSRLAAWGVGGCLADDMGLGKTIQTLALLTRRRESGPALVVTPTSVSANWVQETRRFAPELEPVLYRCADRDALMERAGPGTLVIASYALLRLDLERLRRVRWGTLVLDEAQNVKNSQTQTARAVRIIEAQWRLALTGTPVENHLGELWSVFRAVCPGLFGSWERFRSRFAEPIERRRDAGRRQALSRLVRPFILRRTKSEVLHELPERTEVRLDAVLSPEERRLYEDERLRSIARLTRPASKGEDRRFEVLAALTRLRQLACHPRLVDEAYKGTSAKLKLFLGTLETLRAEGHRALVFSQFTRHLAIVREELEARGIAYEYLDGSTPARQRDERVERFQKGSAEVFLISLKAGGSGLNLTAADYVIHLDPWWNPAVEDQASDRAHRIGQSRPVTIYRIVATGTIEEEILALHDEKRDLIAGVLEGTDRAGKLSTAELIAIIRSGGESVGAKEAAEPADEEDEDPGEERVVFENASPPRKEHAGAVLAQAADRANGSAAVPVARASRRSWFDFERHLVSTGKVEETARSYARIAAEALASPSGLPSGQEFEAAAERLVESSLARRLHLSHNKQIFARAACGRLCEFLLRLGEIDGERAERIQVTLRRWKVPAPSNW